MGPSPRRQAKASQGRWDKGLRTARRVEADCNPGHSVDSETETLSSAPQAPHTHTAQHRAVASPGGP